MLRAFKFHKTATNQNSKEKSIKINYFFSAMYRVFALLIPIVSTPYLTRVLTADGIGTFSYVSSYSTYFLLVGLLGFGLYGQRLIASHRDNKFQSSKDFWELYICQFFVSLVAVVGFSLFAIFQPFGNKYKLCFFIEILTVSSAFFNVNFFLEGNEQFSKVAIRDAIIKIGTLASIFIFIKSSSDVWVYSLIIALSMILSNISVWPYVLRNVSKIPLKILKPQKHFLPCLLLFLPTIAAKIYPLVDKTLIGLITKEDAQIGNYAKAQQLVDSCTLLLTALGVVISPRNAYLLSNGKKDEFLNNIKKAFRFVWFLGLPMTIGIISIANNLVPWYLNSSDFSSASGIMMILSATILLCGIRNVYGMQYLVSSGNDKKYVIAILIGVVSNICLSIPFVFLIGNYGAAIASVAAEMLICLLMSLFSKKDINSKIIFNGFWKYFVASIVMASVTIPFGFVFAPSIINTAIIIGTGIILYFSTLLLLKDDMLLSLLSHFEEKISNISFFSRAKTKNVFALIFIGLVSLTALSYAPIFRKFGLNHFIFIVWLIYTLSILPLSFKKIKTSIPILFIAIFPFLLFIGFSSLFISNKFLANDLTKEIIIAIYLFFVGMLTSSFFQKKHFKKLLISFFAVNIFMAIDLFIEYFIGFDFSTASYAYPEKNGIAPLFAIAASVPFIYMPKRKVLFVFEILGSVFLIIMIALLKCRAVLIALPILIIYLSLNPKYKPGTIYIVLGAMIVSILIVVSVPSLRELVLNNILFANRNTGSIDDLSSGRLTYIANAFKVFTISPIIGMGNYYVDFVFADILASYGIVGLILILHLLFLPILLFFKTRKKLNFQIKMIFVIILLIFYINSLFEAYAPFGPGIKCYMLWIFAGMLATGSEKYAGQYIEEDISPSFEVETMEIVL